MLLILIFWSGAALAENSECPAGYIDAPPRGLSCLHCLHPNAPGGVTPFVNLMRKSCLAQPVMAFVVDGSFGWNADRLKEAIDGLAADGRKGMLHLYVYNGPAQRRWASNLFRSFAVMHPATFLRKIKGDTAFQEEYASVVRDRIVPAVSYAQALGVKVTVAPGLEDNLDGEGFDKALELVRSQMPAEAHVDYVRSACYKCLFTSRSDAAVKDESHSLSAKEIPYGGILHTDGDYFRFAKERNVEFPPLSSFRRLRDLAGDRGSAFILWVGKYQDSPPNLIPVSPDTRTYKAPTREEERQIITFLRRGAGKQAE